MDKDLPFNDHPDSDTRKGPNKLLRKIIKSLFKNLESASSC